MRAAKQEKEKKEKRTIELNYTKARRTWTYGLKLRHTNFWNGQDDGWTSLLLGAMGKVSARRIASNSGRGVRDRSAIYLTFTIGMTCQTIVLYSNCNCAKNI